MKPRNLTINNNQLYLSGHSLCDLANKYQTPLYVYDEKELHERMIEYKNLFKSKKFAKNSVLTGNIIPAKSSIADISIRPIS